MEQVVVRRGLFLKPFKRGLESVIPKTGSLPCGALTNIDVKHYAKKISIADFRVVICVTIFRKPAHRGMSLLLTILSTRKGPAPIGVVFYGKKGNNETYFGIFGNLRPLSELIDYLRFYT